VRHLLLVMVLIAPKRMIDEMTQTEQVCPPSPPKATDFYEPSSILYSNQDAGSSFYFMLPPSSPEKLRPHSTSPERLKSKTPSQIPVSASSKREAFPQKNGHAKGSSSANKKPSQKIHSTQTPSKAVHSFQKKTTESQKPIKPKEAAKKHASDHRVEVIRLDQPSVGKPIMENPFVPPAPKNEIRIDISDPHLRPLIEIVREFLSSHVALALESN
jgi:hypothetical protein